MASQDVIVTYRAEVDDLTQKLRVVIDRLDKLETESKQAAKGLDTTTKSADKLEKELDSVGKSTKKATDNVKTFAKSAKTDLGGLGSQVTSIGLGIATGFAAAFSVDAITRFGQASISAFLEAQENAEKLRFTITQVGGESEAAFQRLIDQSEKLQKITIFSDDSLQQAQNALATFGLTATEIENLIPKLADFASATKTDIVQAAQQVGAGLQGTGREFKKYGIEVSATATAVENLSAITEGFARFQGAAAKETETLSGQLKQQANRADELQEALGSKLAPIFVRLKTVLFEATLGILGFNKALEDAAAQKTTTIENNILKSAEKIKQAGKDVVSEFSARVDELKAVNEKAGQDIEAINKRITDRIAELSRSASDVVPEDDRIVRNLQKQIEATEKIIATTNDKIKAFTKVIEQEQQIASQNERTLTSDGLRIKSIEELNRLLTENNKLNDLVSQANVDLINKELEARKKLSAELEKNKDVRIAGSAEEVKALKAISAEYADLFALLSDQDKAQLIELSVTAEVDTVADLNDKINRLKELIKNADLALPVLTDPDGNLLELPRQVEVLKATLESNGIAIPVDIETTSLDNLRQKVAELSVALQKELTIPVTLEAPEEIEMNTGIPEAVDNDLNRWFERNQEILSTAQDLMSSLQALSQQYTQNQIAQIEEVKNKQIEALDQQQREVDKNLSLRRISETDAQKLTEQLTAKRIATEEKAAEKERAIKRKQFALDKAAALLQIVINTAEGVSKALASAPPPGNFALAALVGAAGAAEGVIVATQPNPYKKGTKSAKPGLALVDEAGSEAILRTREGKLTILDKGDKVLPAHKTVTYGKVLDTMFDGTFDKHYMKKEIAPRLVKQRQLHEKAEKKSFARNISESLVINSQLNTDPIARQLGKGMSLNNADEIGQAVARHIQIDPYRR